MKKHQLLVLGSGIGGLAAGAELKSKGIENFVIIDKCPEVPMNLHNGVHYLHSDDFGTPFPFELKKISAVEEIWNPRTNEWKPRANIPEMINYSMKVMGLRHPSSIMDPGNRQWDVFLPVSNDMNDLIRAYKDYIGDHFIFNESIEYIDTENKIACTKNDEYNYEYIFSTIPLNTMHDICKIEKTNQFKNTSVHITNYKTNNIVSNWLVGIYISDDKFPIYRITVLNGIISMESVVPFTIFDEHIIKYHLEEYFDYSLDTKEYYAWETGRIFGLTKQEREITLKKFSDNDIFQVGRYGQWDGKLIMDTTIKQSKNIIDRINKNICK